MLSGSDAGARSSVAIATRTIVARIATARARTIGRRRGSIRESVATYLTVSVPVIPAIGWTEQMKTYVPAGRGWYE